MDILFSKILSMSFSASFVIGAVLVFRILLRKAPKKYSYVLWLLVFLRLLCPVTLTSSFSLLPVKENAVVYQSGTYGGVVRLDIGMEGTDAARVSADVAGSSAVTEGVSVDARETVGSVEAPFHIAAYTVWLLGAVVLLVYSLVQILLLKRKLRTAVLCESGNTAEKGNCPVYESEYISTAFLFGLFRPRIYLPLGIEEEREFVIAHERMHKRRWDHMVKPVCYLAVLLHWFNPLVWIAFYFMTKDMEMSCDEQVLKEAMDDIRGAYSRSLLNLSVKGSGLTFPLAFGEISTKERIRHALTYKKPSVWISMGAILLLLIAAVTLLTGSNGNRTYTGFWNGSGEDLQEGSESLYQQLSDSRSLYIGDASANGRLVGLLPGIQGYESRGMELQTQERPYELKINYVQTEPVTVRQEQENAETIRRNALYLFATIENMDICTYSLDDTQQISQTSYTRSQLEEIFGPLYEKSETPQGLEQLETDYQAYQEGQKKRLDSTPDDPNTEVEANTPDDPNTEVEASTPNDPKAAVEKVLSAAILEYTSDSYEALPEEGSSYAEAHVVLGGEEEMLRQLLQSDGEMVYYLLVRTAVFGDMAGELTGNQVNVTDMREEGVQTLEEAILSGSCFPAMVRISIGENGAYRLEKLWTPRAGDYFEKDIKEIFPEEYWDAAITMEGYRKHLDDTLLQKAFQNLEQEG